MQTVNVRFFISWVCLIVLLGSGCDQARRDFYLKTHSDLSIETALNIKKGKVTLDMNKEEVIASWGSRCVIDYDEKGEVWKYEVSGTDGVWVRNIRFEDGKVLSVKSNLVPVKRDRSWDKHTPTTVRD